MLLHPCPVLVDIGGIDHEEEVVLAHLVDEQVVDRSTVLVAHHAVEDLPYWGTSHIIGEDMLHIALGILAAHRYLSHVRDIEESHLLSDCMMLWGNACILIEQRHVKASERHHRRTKRHMLVVQARHLVFLFQFLSNSHTLFCLLFTVYCLQLITSAAVIRPPVISSVNCKPSTVNNSIRLSPWQSVSLISALTSSRLSVV